MARKAQYDPSLTVRFPPLLRKALDDIAKKRYGGLMSNALRIAAARFVAYEYEILGEGKPKTDPMYWLSAAGVDDHKTTAHDDRWKYLEEYEDLPNDE